MTRDEAVAVLLDIADKMRGGPAVMATAVLAITDAIEARMGALELALTETNRRVPTSASKPTDRVFGIPVALADRVDVQRIRDTIAELPKGLSGEQVVDELAERGLLRRTDK